MGGIYTVRQGDCLSSIAKEFGFSDWKTIYHHAQNAAFRDERPNPNVIYPGDKLYIPDCDCGSDDAPTEDTHRYVARRSKTWLRLIVMDAQWRPAAGKRYTLEVANRTWEGETGGDGLIQREIPAGARSGTLTVWLEEGVLDGHVWELDIGKLDPIETMTGVQARLNNLGFLCGQIDGVMGPLTRVAVRSFQEKYGLAVDGIPGPKTQSKLKEVHGC